ncbi:hypothetical protein MPSEU_000419600 [Mayamaea pseudoterrestris]|nr:hypothetical protein MPSEU_000419600 [Mayamaea pseudoterrestris]
MVHSLQHLLIILTIAFNARISSAWIQRYGTPSPALATRLDAHSSPSLSSSNIFLSVNECLTLFQNKVDANGRRIKFVDGTWFHKGDRVGRNEHEQGPRIPGSVYFDIDDLSATNPTIIQDLERGNATKLQLQHMLPPLSLFAAAMATFNISRQDHVIVYGRKGHTFLPRIWFHFHVMQQGQVSIMEGCLDDWMAASGPVDTDTLNVPKAVKMMIEWDELHKSNLSGNNHDQYPSTLQLNTFATKEQVLETLTRSVTAKESLTSTLLLDARGSSFKRQGHVPGSIHIPYSSLQSSPGVWKSTNDLLDLFRNVGVDPVDETVPIICSCGSGVSACSLYLALRLCGRSANTLVYDGSWDEWSKDDSLPKVLPKCSSNIII